MSSDDLKGKTRRFAQQHYQLYGPIIKRTSSTVDAKGDEIMARGKEEASQPDPLFSDSDSFSWFGEKVDRIDEPWTRSRTLKSFEEKIQDCRKCPLWETRTNVVFGTGNPEADIMVIGEAPGADEDQQGKPFVGAAGKLLTKILEAINLSRDDVYICNIVKSRPPGNRKPEKYEVEACIPYLYKQIDMVKPKFILALGLTAAKSLLGTNEPMKDLRGKVQDWHGISVIITYHPAALLRNPHWKRPTWEDVQLLRKLYDEGIA